MGWCSSCGKVVVTERDEINGFTCCTGCGRVLDDNVYSSDVTFSKTAAGQSQADGNFVRDSQQGSIGRLGGRSFGSHSDSHEKTLGKGRMEIVEIVDRLQIKPKEDAINAAHRLYTIAVERNFTRGRRTNQVAGACLYIVCRQDSKPYMLIDFSDSLQTNVYVLGAVFLQLCRLLRLEQHPIMQKPVDPSLFIHRFADRLHFGKKTHTVANTALRLVASMKRDWMQTGRRPSGICGAALFISSHIHGFEHTKSDVVSVVHICEATLKKRLDEFETTESGQLTAEEFEVKAKEIELQMRTVEVPVVNAGGITEILCEHKEFGAAHFAHGLCRACYDEFVRVSGGMQGGSAPPAFQRAEKLRLKAEEEKEAQRLKLATISTDTTGEPSTSKEQAEIRSGATSRRGQCGDINVAEVCDKDNAVNMPKQIMRIKDSTPGTTPGQDVCRDLKVDGNRELPLEPRDTLEGLAPGHEAKGTCAPDSGERTCNCEKRNEAGELGSFGPCDVHKTNVAEGDETVNGTDETLSDIDDDEVTGYLFNEEEVKLKTVLWMHMNKDYLEAQEAKSAALAKTEAAQAAALAAAASNDASAAELAAAVAAALDKQKKERKQKRAENASKRVPAESAVEATRQMLERKKLSSKVNYNVLAKLFDQESDNVVDEPGNVKESPGNGPAVKRMRSMSGEPVPSSTSGVTVDKEQEHSAVSLDEPVNQPSDGEDDDDGSVEDVGANEPSKYRLHYDKNDEYEEDEDY